MQLGIPAHVFDGSGRNPQTHTDRLANGSGSANSIHLFIGEYVSFSAPRGGWYERVAEQ
jgi:hypothetical protein